MSESYKKSGVDIDAGNEFVDLIAPHVKSTRVRGVISDVGGYGALFAPDISDMKEPVLVSGTDGVGTKLKLAIDSGRLDKIGIDLVAMCVNDIACSGAKPLFFLDYFATSKLEPKNHAPVVAGIAEGCRIAKCALVGGETAELPGFYQKGDFDLAGFAVGIVDRSKIIDGSEISEGCAVIGVHSSGFHSNGYSLVHHTVKNAKLDLKAKYEGMDETLEDLLLRPTIIYTPLTEKLTKSFKLLGIAHITGGGFYDNIPRILPAGVCADIDASTFQVPPVMRLIQEHARMDDKELFRVFNCGIGLVLVALASDASDLIDAARTAGCEASLIGKIRRRQPDEPDVIIK